MAVARRTDRLALDTLLGFILEPEALLIRLESLELDKERTNQKRKRRRKKSVKKNVRRMVRKMHFCSAPELISAYLSTQAAHLFQNVSFDRRRL